METKRLHFSLLTVEIHFPFPHPLSTHINNQDINIWYLGGVTEVTFVIFMIYSYSYFFSIHSVFTQPHYVVTNCMSVHYFNILDFYYRENPNWE